MSSVDQSDTGGERSENRSSLETRRMLVDAGVREFGLRGYSAVSTRDLAEVAGVNLAAIPYHFGGKEGLYHAAWDQIVGEARLKCAKTAKAITDRLDLESNVEGSGVDELSGVISVDAWQDEIRDLVTTIVGFLVARGKDRYRSALIMRELMEPSPGFDRLYQGYMKQVHTSVTRLVATLLQEDPESTSCILRAHALLGQIVFFCAGRELIKARTDGREFTSERLQQIATIITENFIVTLRGLQEMKK